MPACLHASNAFIPAAMPLSLQEYVSSSIVDRHRFESDPDPTVCFDADQDFRILSQVLHM
jgi:hypothetical protein